MHTIQDLALGDIAVEARRLRREVSALQLAVRPMAVAIAMEWKVLDSKIQESLDRLLVSTAPADLKAIADVLHGLYQDMADMFAVMNIEHELHPPRAADLMSEFPCGTPVSHDPKGGDCQCSDCEEPPTLGSGGDLVVSQIV